MERCLYRYHLLMRPPYPGSIPIDGLVNVHDEESTAPSGHHTWGWAEYRRKLSDQEVKNWELEEDDYE